MARLSKYRKHSSRNQAFVEYQGKRTYLPGKFNSQKSRAAYASFLRTLTSEVPPPSLCEAPTVSDLVAGFLDWAAIYYRGSHEYIQLRDACKVLLHKHCFHPVGEFRAADLTAVRDQMISGA